MFKDFYIGLKMRKSHALPIPVIKALRKLGIDIKDHKTKPFKKLFKSLNNAIR